MGDAALVGFAGLGVASLLLKLAAGFAIAAIAVAVLGVPASVLASAGRSGHGDMGLGGLFLFGGLMLVLASAAVHWDNVPEHHAAQEERCLLLLDDYQWAIDASGGKGGDAVSHMTAILFAVDTPVAPHLGEPAAEAVDLLVDAGCPADRMRTAMAEWPERRVLIARVEQSVESSAVRTLIGVVGTPTGGEPAP